MGKVKAQRINARIQAGVNKAVKEVHEHRELERARNRAAYRARPHFTRDDVLGALVVQASGRKWEVVRVNQKTVTVKETDTFNTTIPFKEITFVWR